MHTYSLRASLAERARKTTPTLDIAAPKRALLSVHRKSIGLEASSTVRPVFSGLDGIRMSEYPSLTKRDGRSQRYMRITLLRRAQLFFRRVGRLLDLISPTFAPHKALYASLAGGIAFGMVTMAFIGHVFGPGVFARSNQGAALEVPSHQAAPSSQITASHIPEYIPDQDIFFEYFGQVTKEKYEASVRDMVRGYPIEAMLPYIFEQDRLTAAFLIGIAKKESNWGKRIPVLEGQDCFNYWGYRGIRRMMGSGGHTCFNGRQDAVETVATRLEKLIESEKLDTPEKMIVWKCGFSCDGHSRESVKKWISDVDMYFSQLSDE